MERLSHYLLIKLKLSTTCYYIFKTKKHIQLKKYLRKAKLLFYHLSCFLSNESKFGLVCHVGGDSKCALKEKVKCALKARYVYFIHEKWDIPITNNDDFFKTLMELAALNKWELV